MERYENIRSTLTRLGFNPGVSDFPQLYYIHTRTKLTIKLRDTRYIL